MNRASGVGHRASGPGRAARRLALCALAATLASVSCSKTPEDSSRFRSSDEIAADLARGPIPGFAGTMRLPDQRQVIFMTAAGDIETARSYVDERGNRRFASVDSVIRVRYDMAQLFDWLSRIERSAVRESLVSTHIAEADNRIVLGAYGDDVEWVRKVAAGLGIPDAAVHVSDGSMIVRGLVVQVDSTRHEFVVRDPSGEMLQGVERVIVRYGEGIAVPRVGDCVELESPAAVMESLPPQIGVRRLRRVPC